MAHPVKPKCPCALRLPNFLNIQFSVALPSLGSSIHSHSHLTAPGELPAPRVPNNQFLHHAIATFLIPIIYANMEVTPVCHEVYSSIFSFVLLVSMSLRWTVRAKHSCLHPVCTYLDIVVASALHGVVIAQGELERYSTFPLSAVVQFGKP